MIFPDLPVPKTKEQSVIHAKTYADTIRDSHQLKQLKSYRLQLDEKKAPDWFILMVDIEINFILYRVDYLNNYHGKNDPRSYALDSRQYMRVAMDMMRNFLNPARMYWLSTARAAEWLKAE
ncbi:hypothetical protein ACRKSW_05005 [Providencia sp. 2024EL-00811]|uniref:hypothetical protein n=1 Tax=Providencia TaxID=586 RepID=UPI0023618816|nr:hypothetical protein [Providencia rettgeri]